MWRIAILACVVAAGCQLAGLKNQCTVDADCNDGRQCGVDGTCQPAGSPRNDGAVTPHDIAVPGAKDDLAVTGPPLCQLDGGVSATEVDGWAIDDTSPDRHPCTCAQPDGQVISIGGNNVALARALLTGRWLVCYRSSDTIGPWMPAGWVGLEVTADDHWYFLFPSQGGAIVRGQGFDAQGVIMYNPLPGPDWEQVSLSASGKYADFTVAFADPPRKLRLLGPSSFTAILVPLGM